VGGIKEMKPMKKKFVILLFALGLYAVASATVAQPTIQEVRLDPEEPAPGSIITFNATINSAESLDEVWLTVKECTDILCFADKQNESMENIEGSDFYEVDITLLHDDATYINYFIDVKVNDTWYQFRDFTNVTLTPESNGPPQNGDNGNGSNETLGFETITVLLAIIIGLVILRRKRL
jgi:hypothetical protein